MQLRVIFNKAKQRAKQSKEEKRAQAEASVPLKYIKKFVCT